MQSLTTSTTSSDLFSTSMSNCRPYTCCECNFVAASSRLLSRHKAITHSNNPLSCPLCPFVTIYQTNLLRHRREVHGILGTKGNKTCKFCPFKATDNETLIDHHTKKHQDILALAIERFAKERSHATAKPGCNKQQQQQQQQLDLPQQQQQDVISPFLTPPDKDCFDHNVTIDFPGKSFQYPSSIGTQITSDSISTSSTISKEYTDVRGKTVKTTSTWFPELESSDDLSEVESVDLDMKYVVDFVNVDPNNIRPSIVEKIKVSIEQLCLIERLEIADYLTEVKENINYSLPYKCQICPAEFKKNCSFQFHKSLHGYKGEVCCELCNYAVDFEENLFVHQQLHFSNLE